jgi:hypothetical protein
MQIKNITSKLLIVIITINIIIMKLIIKKINKIAYLYIKLEKFEII